MNILVTGGAGFIGSNIAETLLQEGHTVDIVDDLSSGIEENIPKDAAFYKVDISSPEFKKIFTERKYDCICHHAAQIDVRSSVQDPILDNRINVLGSIRTIQMCINYRIPRYIFASSGGAVYGEQKHFPADEEHPTNPDSPYGIHKLAVEKYLHFYWKHYGLSYIALRYGNVYGPRQNPYGEAGVVAIFLNQILNGIRPTIYGDGTQTRDYLYISDAVKSNIQAIHSDVTGCFNIGTGKETDLNSIVRHLRELTATNMDFELAPPRKGEQKRSVLDIRKAGELLGWEPEVSLEEGLSKTLHYFRTNGPGQKNEPKGRGSSNTRRW